MFELIAELRGAAGVTVMLVEQNVHQALDISDRAYVLRSGAVEMSGTPADIRRVGVEQAYLGATEARASGMGSPPAS